MFDDNNRELMLSLIDAVLIIALLIEIAAFAGRLELMRMEVEKASHGDLWRRKGRSASE